MPVEKLVLAGRPVAERCDEVMGPLEDIRVLDAGQVVAGPMIAQILGDFGAEVIKIEPPGVGDPYRGYGPRKRDIPLGWKALSRNKKSVTVDLRQQEGVAVLHKLLKKVDIVVSSFRPATARRFGLDPEAVFHQNPDTTLILVSGFGQDGPSAERPGFGTLAEAMSGFAHLTGEPEGPPTLPMMPLADSVAALYGVIGALISIRSREQKGGHGQVIDLSLLEPLASILGPMPTYYDQLGLIVNRMGSRNDANAPRNVYQTKDQKWVAIAASVPAIAERCFRAMGLTWMLDDPRFATASARVENVGEVDTYVGAWVAERTRDEVLEALTDADVAVAPVLNTQEYMEDPQVHHRGSVVSVEDEDFGSIRMHGVLPRLSATPGSIRWTGPRLGEHTAQVLKDVAGLTTEELRNLREKRVI